MFLLNTKTKDFPLSRVDIQLYEKDWTEEQPIPDYFVEVEIEPFPAWAEDETMESNEPKLIDGKWVQTHFVRKLTKKELETIAEQKAELEQRRINAGLPPEPRTVVLDENGNVIIDQWGNTVEPKSSIE